MTKPNSPDQKRAILDYWTLVEFFSPYILENTLNYKNHYQKIYADAPATEPLPWQQALPIEENSLASPFAKGYNLFLGLFSIEETADRARHAFAKEPSRRQSVDWRSCSEANAMTCFARLTVSTHGIPLFGTLSLSTLPWAHGHLLAGNVDALTLEMYWKSVSRFILSLREELAEILPIRLVKNPDKTAGWLDLYALFRLVELLNQWAGYKPTGYPLVLIQPVPEEQSQGAAEPQFKPEREIPILNSFYIQDLEFAAVSLESQKGRPVDLYLCNNEEKRIEIESDEGKKFLHETILPEKMPLGRWPNALSHRQNLMQQFAANAGFDSLKTTGIFSVNGPPGTGKTLLLREIIAGNIVARAEALSKFERAKDAFVGRQALNFETGDPILVSMLDPSLLGYEMLVLSSNNTAVQNLTRELPLRSELDAAFRHASYLETVAAKALGLKEKEAWGLISAALGNASNCKQFVENVFMTRCEEKGKSRIWEWIDDYEGLSFNEAKAAFIEVKKRHTAILEELELFTFLHNEIEGHTVETYCKNTLADFTESEKSSADIHEIIKGLVQQESDLKELLACQKAKESLCERERPNTIDRVLRRKNFKAWGEQFRACGKEQTKTLEELCTCKESLKAMRQQSLEQTEIEEELREKLLNEVLLFYAYEEAYRKLKEAHPEMRFPKNADEFAESHVHLNSYFQSEKSNRVRSELFIAAMTLHEAWLAETARTKGGFRGNLMAISHLLQGRTPTTMDDTRLAWQSVFLFLPVISSTFASVGRLFRHLEPGSLGWVLIDEAGQAMPQAAVGAIWRAQRVLSIGDPFQIEPICTIPPEVIDGMAKSKIKDYTLSWAASQVSVQNLMDRASIFGTVRAYSEESVWLGSPLRVHRRCLEPMFTIANTIAYENSMLFATSDADNALLHPSCWWDVCGRAGIRQYVPEQGNALMHLLTDSFGKMDVPDIFIISPFREVTGQLQQLVLGNRELNLFFKRKFPSVILRNWVQQSIGTVHAFQGKQAAVVFFVLGADKSNLGAIEWASRKPNLLNVAVTRAQARFYVIGDYKLWKTWPHFDVAAKNLPRHSLEY